MFSAWSTIFFTVSRQVHTFISCPHAVAKDYRAVIFRNQAARHILRAAHRREVIKKNILPLIDNKIGKLLLRMPIVNDKIKRTCAKRLWMSSAAISMKSSSAAHLQRRRGTLPQTDRLPLHHCLRHDGMRSYHLFQPLGNLETGLLRKSHHPHGSKDRLSRPSERGRRNNL